MAYVVGALGIIVNMLIYQQKNGQHLIFYKLISDVLWALHYFLLDAYTGMAVAIIGILREIVFYYKHKNWAKSNFWLIFFISCSIVSALFTWAGPKSLLPTIASIVSVISFWYKTPKLSRVLGLFISGLMFTYDILCLSYLGIANEIFTIISIIIGIFRYKNSKPSSSNTAM